MSRYKTKRTLIDWGQNDALKIAKQTAGVIMRFEAVNQVSLYNERFPALFPLITKSVAGFTMSFRELKDQTFEAQGKKITPNKLFGRGDVVNRKGYEETDEFTILVTEAYLEITKAKVTLDDRRCFSDEEVLVAAIRQKRICANPACRSPFSPLNPPVGDHAIAWAHGGRTIQENCKAICTRCNNDKKDLSFDEYVAKCAMINSRGRIRLGAILTNT